MRKFIVLSTALAMTGCATAPNQKQTVDAKMVIGTIALIAVAGALGKQQHASKCANNNAGFYQNQSSGNIYTCP
jgi:hypothetical protein